MEVGRVGKRRWRELLVMGETGNVLAVNHLTARKLLPPAIVAARGRSNLRSISIHGGEIRALSTRNVILRVAVTMFSYPDSMKSHYSQRIHCRTHTWTCRSKVRTVRSPDGQLFQVGLSFATAYSSALESCCWNWHTRHRCTLCKDLQMWTPTCHRTQTIILRTV